MADEEKDFLDGMSETVETEEPEKDDPKAPEPEKGEEPETPEPEKEEPEAPPAPEPQQQGTVPYAAMKAEREKRQRLEAELAKLQQEQEKEQAPNFYEAPEQHLEHVLNRVRTESNQRLYAALEEQARELYPDYDEVFTEVEAHVQANPGSEREIFSSANPALAAYKFGKQLLERKELENPEAYKAKLKAEILAELQADQNKAKEEARRKAAESIPPDLATTRSAHSGEPAVESVFDDIFKT